MSSSHFRITEHIVPAQHIREYARATAGVDDSLRLAVKKYSPIDNPYSKRGDVTIIAAHGSGLPKELYEPMFEEIHRRSKNSGFNIRSIWFADAAHQGASGILNERHLGNDPSWLDHARDILAMVNFFRDDMVRPIIGIGHSMGAGQLLLTSIMHPRLFTSLVLLEPVFDTSIHLCQGPALTRASTFRQDVWASNEEAANAARRTYKRWDKRVFERWMEYGYRALPTVVHPTGEAPVSAKFDVNKWIDNRSPDPVTLATTKHQEVFSYLRPNFKGLRADSSGSSDHVHGSTHTVRLEQRATGSDILDKLDFPDVMGPQDATTPFYRPEIIIATLALPHIRPSVLYLFGEKSPISLPNLRKFKIERTGIGIGGSGGAREDMVKEVVVSRGSHMVPLECVDACAEAVANWLRDEIARWREAESKFIETWESKPLREKVMVSPEWCEKIKSLL